jgi:hypothetical protein
LGAIKKPNAELLCASRSRPRKWISPEIILKGFKVCCISEKMDGRKDQEEFGNVCSEYESVSSECEKAGIDRTLNLR